MRILLIGSTGLLGRDLSSALKWKRWEVFGPRRAELDIRDHGAVEEYVYAHAPDVIINAAGMTNVDLCETNVNATYEVNSDAQSCIADICRRNGMKCVYISTNYVFGGSDDPIKPDAPYNPLNVYGASKMDGEISTQAAGDHLIVRTSWLYNLTSNNFITSMLDSVNPKCAVDIVSCHTHTVDLSLAITHLIAADAYGRFHFTGASAGTPYEIAFNMGRRPSPVTQKGTATRPARCVLDSSVTYDILDKLEEK